MYIHSFMCVYVCRSSEYTYVCKHPHRSARTFAHTSTSSSANRHPSAYHAPLCTYTSPSSMTVEIAARLTLWLSASRLRASHFPWQPCVCAGRTWVKLRPPACGEHGWRPSIAAKERHRDLGRASPLQVAGGRRGRGFEAPRALRTTRWKLGREGFCLGTRSDGMYVHAKILGECTGRFTHPAIHHPSSTQQ